MGMKALSRTVQVDSDLFSRTTESIANFLSDYSAYLGIFFAFVVVTLIIIFVINIGKLSQAGDNMMLRQQAIKGILVTGICLAVLSSFGIILGVIVGFLLI